MGPGAIESGKNGTGYLAEVDSNNDLHTRALIANGSNEAAVTAGGELLTLSKIVGGGNELAIDGDGAVAA